MATDVAQKRTSNPAIDEDSEIKPGVLKLFGKIGGKAARRGAQDSLLSPTSTSGATQPPPANSTQVMQTQSSIRSSAGVARTPLSAREDSHRKVPSLALPSAASLTEIPEMSPGRAVGAKKAVEPSDRSLNASTTSLALRKLFLGKPESLTTDDFALWKQFRDMEPDFFLEVNATSPYPFLKVAVRHTSVSTFFRLPPPFFARSLLFSFLMDCVVKFASLVCLGWRGSFTRDNLPVHMKILFSNYRLASPPHFLLSTLTGLLSFAQPPNEEDDPDDHRDAPPDLTKSVAVMNELLPPKEDPHDVPYEQWYGQMINLVQLHKQELSTSKYNEASTPRSARVQSAELRGQ